MNNLIYLILILYIYILIIEYYEVISQGYGIGWFEDEIPQFWSGSKSPVFQVIQINVFFM